MARVSRGTLMKATADLQTELEARIYESLWARVRRYFSDRVLRQKLVVARAAQKALDQGGDS
jgi:hypothetical protein